MLPRQEGPISDGAVRRAVKHDTSGDRRAMPHTRLLVNTAGVEPVGGELLLSPQSVEIIKFGDPGSGR